MLHDNECGILVALESVHSLFPSPQPPSFDLDDDDDENQPPVLSDVSFATIRRFPMAGLRTAGHIQVDAVMPVMDKVLNHINSNVKIAGRLHQQLPQGTHHDDNHHPIIDLDDQDSRLPLQGESTQMYNLFTHQAMNPLEGSDFQKAELTGAFAGDYATPQKHKALALRLKQRCARALPHQRFQKRLDVHDCPKSLRIEQVWVIDIQALNPDLRNGRLAFFLALLFINPRIHSAIVISTSATSTPRSLSPSRGQ